MMAGFSIVFSLTGDSSLGAIGHVGEAGIGLPGGGIGQHSDEGHALLPHPVGGGYGITGC